MSGRRRYLILLQLSQSTSAQTCAFPFARGADTASKQNLIAYPLVSMTADHAVPEKETGNNRAHTKPQSAGFSSQPGETEASREDREPRKKTNQKRNQKKVAICLVSVSCSARSNASIATNAKRQVRWRCRTEKDASTGSLRRVTGEKKAKASVVTQRLGPPALAGRERTVWHATR